MKKQILSRLLSLMLVLVLSVSLLAGCSSEEVPYSASAEEYDDVYVTLVSIEPMVKVGTGENYTETACVCYTTSGDEVWVYIDIDEYKELFDSSANFFGDNWWADRVDFSAPITFHGEMRDAEDLCEGLSYDIGNSLIIVYRSHD